MISSWFDLWRERTYFRILELDTKKDIRNFLEKVEKELYKNMNSENSLFAFGAKEAFKITTILWVEVTYNKYQELDDFKKYVKAVCLVQPFTIETLLNKKWDQIKEEKNEEPN